MGFTTPCFIRKNTDNIRNRLKELGYYCNPYLGWHNLCTCMFGIISVYSWRDDDINGLKEIDVLIDCGTNEELFLAIAALVNDKYFKVSELDFFSETIDWEQRRYELAKEIVNVVIANDIGVCSDAIAKYSVNCANAIIKRLKEVNNE